jgi:peptidoglycan/LPS O-acetylase OafA/YrhL
VSNIAILRPKMPELDSLRGVAILSVVFYHGLFWSSGLEGLSGFTRVFVNVTRAGWLGVNLFFVLSGFLITGILLGMRNKPGYYRAFYTRRALRILPALYALLLVLCFVPGQSHKYVALSFFFCANLYSLLHVPQTYGMLWSLAVEEHFYLFWPWAVRRLSSRLLYWFVAVLLLGSPALRALSYRNPLPEGFSGFTWLILDGFASGVLLALLIREQWFGRRQLLLISSAAIGGACLVIAVGLHFGILNRMTFIGATFNFSVMNLLFFGILGSVLWCGSSAWSVLVHRPLLRFYGEISYGLYLYHWLVFTAYDSMVRWFWPAASHTMHQGKFISIRFAVVMAGATGLAYISRWFYEERFLRVRPSNVATADT